MIPANVYAAARRIYIDNSDSPIIDDRTITDYARQRWPQGFPARVYTLAFWILSQAAQDERE